MPLKGGDRVDRYEILGLLGEGGMGDVYRAHDTRLRRSVALKLLRPLPPSDESSTATGGAVRILREARVVASLEHPNIVAIYDVGEVTEPADLNGTAFIAMELVRGQSLRAYVGDESIPVNERVRWLADTARALGAAHDKGLVHRDVKPENVMVRDDGAVKVLDFGVAKRTHVPMGEDSSNEAHLFTTVSAGGVVGTLYYMAPEQLRNETLDGRTDEFAWGVMAYELLTGRGPWTIEGGVLQVVSEILSKTPAAPAIVRPEVSPELSAIVMRALERSPADRFASMSDVIAALDEVPGTFARAATVIRVSSRAPSGEASSDHVSPNAVTLSAPPSLGAPRAAIREQSSRGHAAAPPRTKRRLLRIAGIVVVAAIGAIYVARAIGRRDVAIAVPADARPPSACVSNKACTESLGQPAVCRRDLGSCALLASEDCTVSAEPRDLESDDTIWIGAMFPKTGPEAEEHGIVNHNAVELARRDFAQVMAGLPGDRVRPLAVLSCDDTSNPKRVASHLVDGVGVAATIGFRTSVEAIELANSVFVPRGTLAISAINANPLVTSVPQPPRGPRLVWRTTYSTADAASAIGRLVEDVLEPSVRSEGRVGPNQTIRVASLRPKQAAGAALADALFAKLRYNGKGALENGADFHEIAFDADAPEGSPELTRATEQLLAYKPNVIIFAGGRAIVRSVFDPLETRWPVGPPRPRYVSMAAIYPDVLELIGRDAGRRRRFFGVTPVADTPANARLVMYYSETFPEKITRTTSPNSTYDAFYFIAFASFAVRRDEPVSGERLADAFGRLLPPGRPVDVGIAGILDAYKTLQSGENVDVTGATGKLDFDLALGEAAFDHSILCVGIEPSGRAIDGVPSGLTYITATHKLEGQLRCP